MHAQITGSMLFQPLVSVVVISFLVEVLVVDFVEASLVVHAQLRATNAEGQITMPGIAKPKP